MLHAGPCEHFSLFASFVHHGPSDLHREREHNGGVPLGRDEPDIINHSLTSCQNASSPLTFTHKGFTAA